MSDESANSVFDIVGEDGLTRLVAAFYRRVPDDDLLGSMYPSEDLSGAEYRLRGFLLYRLGGPQTYIEERGHPALRMRHAPFALSPQARDRWMSLMESALVEVEFPEQVAGVLRDFFAHTATFLINRPE